MLHACVQRFDVTEKEVNLRKRAGQTPWKGANGKRMLLQRLAGLLQHRSTACMSPHLPPACSLSSLCTNLKGSNSNLMEEGKKGKWIVFLSNLEPV
jgi:hypothetical protein